MKLSPTVGLFAVLAVSVLSPGIVRADDQTTQNEEETKTDDTAKDELLPDPEPKKIGAGQAAETLPPPQSDDDPQPTPASPVLPTGGVVKQAGVGGEVAYARAGVLELGGSANFVGANDFTQVSINPSIGWFFMDDVEISAILGLSHLSAQGIDATFFNALIEPSLHIPFSDSIFGMVGVGAGLSFVDGPGFGFALAPRLGMNVLVGRSGLLTPQIFAQYSTTEALQTPQGTLLAVSFSYGAGLGYTVMW